MYDAKWQPAIPPATLAVASSAWARNDQAFIDAISQWGDE
jgi:hypothetical protein